MGTLRPRNQGVTTSPGRPIVLHGSLSNSFLWERPTWRGPDSPPWKRSRMAHRSDSEASRLGLNLLLSNHCHWHRLVCYVVFIGYDRGMAGYRGKRMQPTPVTTVLEVLVPNPVPVLPSIPVRRHRYYIGSTVPILHRYVRYQYYTSTHGTGTHGTSTTPVRTVPVRT